MTMGLRARILWTAGIVMVLTVVSLTLTAARAFSSAYAEALFERSAAISHEVAVQFERILALGLRADEIVGFEDQCNKAVANHRDLAFVAVVSSEGRPLFQSKGPQVPAGVFDDPQAVEAIRRGEEARIVIHPQDEGLAIAVKPVVDRSGTAVGAVLVATAQAAIERRLASLYWTVLLVGAGFVVLSAAILYWVLTRFVTSPLLDVVDAVDQLRRQSPGEHRRIDVDVQGEPRVLVDAFNQLLGELERHETELVAARESAHAANKAKTEFLATVSHELRTPLNGILGMNALLMQTTLTDKQARYAGVVDRSGQKLLELIDEILEFSSIESGGVKLEIQPFVLRDAVDDVVARLEGQAQDKGLVLASFVDRDCPEMVAGDARRIQRVLSHLVGNAIKFSDCGMVSVTVRCGSDGIEFSVSDTGIGIPGELREVIFQPFRQGDGSPTRRHGGAGLGLTICLRLVEAMGGSVEFDSVPGQGSTFRVRLPLVRPTTAMPA